MRYSSKQYAQALYQAIYEAKDHEVVLDNFVKLLAQNGDLAKHEEIEAEYKKLDLQSKGISQATVTSSRQIEINTKLIEDLNNITQTKFQTEKQVDQNIVGGIVVRVDDSLLDLSVKNQLENLSKDLKK